MRRLPWRSHPYEWKVWMSESSLRRACGRPGHGDHVEGDAPAFEADAGDDGLRGGRRSLRVVEPGAQLVQGLAGLVVGHVVRGLDQVSEVAAGLRQDVLHRAEDRLDLAGAGRPGGAEE